MRGFRPRVAFQVQVSAHSSCMPASAPAKTVSACANSWWTSSAGEVQSGDTLLTHSRGMLFCVQLGSFSCTRSERIVLVRRFTVVRAGARLFLEDQHDDGST